ncbi:discoidin domain-containing protein [Dactylosporangium sp. NPDC050588]|uniref:Putative alkaline phosphatase n=1 Tax=Dactylosporangium aurantiacum subsp. hamdenensis TaxID=703577 RepID=E9LIR1_9ACTN|nr:putative alkaline phosphatase [Dactylosporangium aurantiacum subsp. hamdenensis]
MLRRPLFVLFTIVVVLAAAAPARARPPADPLAGSALAGCGTRQTPSVVSASTYEDINPPAHAVDGNPDTRWSGYGFGAYLQLELPARATLCAVQVAWFRGDERWNDYTVYTSADGTTFRNVNAGRSTGTTRAMETYAFTPHEARFVRIAFWQNAEQHLWASISEAAVLGVDATGGTQTVVAVGDISQTCVAADCPTARTAALTGQIDPARILGLGDQQNGNDTYEDFLRYFDKTWGPLKGRFHPTPGNHEYEVTGADGYFRYFGPAAKPQGASWYSFDLGNWHIVSLNSEYDRNEGGAQLAWLRADLAATTKPCVAAYWHRPKFSSGSGHGNFPNVKPFWDALYAAGADLVLNGHDHDYERFAPQRPDGVASPAGIREFVVGTGGAGLRPFGTTVANSERRIAGTHGVLRLELGTNDYAWRFVDIDGTTRDQGGPVACH